jgi:hypothetical protein
MSTTNNPLTDPEFEEVDPLEPPTRILPPDEVFAPRPNLDEMERGLDPDSIMLVFSADQIEVVNISSGKEICLGRDHATNTFQPQIDLTKYDGASKGVSRLHASIQHNAGGWWLTDLGSTNGSWLNKKRLAPREPYPLEQVNQVRLGRLDFRVILATSTVTES